MTEATKQAVTGLRIVSFQVKKAKEGEVLKVLLEASVDGMGAGDYDIGDILKAFHVHQTSDTDIGLSVFIQKEE